ncbi:bifunctional diguanylate cyclase/phosphodiesterase [Paraglaciecola sp. L3A3]|uniref:putative bifunctional diguanylate cyclase/phosphodiesterase n=1 Tax=Paraglaciecola sp. L3A3 TaxID=2686358 RepID=UPI0018EEFEE5|nr:EAL domain-containing protein [Paraglaciecola sp. L3A3]
MTVKLDQLKTAIWIYDIEYYKIIWANQAALTLWDSPSVKSLQQRDFKSDQSAAVQESLLQYQQAFSKDRIIQENWFFTPKGKETQVFCQISGYQLPDGRVAMLVEALTPKAQYSNPQFSATTTISNYQIDGKFLSGNPPFTKKFGSNVTHLKELICDPDTLLNLFISINKGQPFEQDVLMKTISGENWYHLTAINFQHKTNDPNILIHHYDIHERKMAEQALQKQAWTDPLTGLLNRRGLAHTLQPIIESNLAFTLLYLDLDGFKMVNDSSGHSTGDLILAEVANRISQSCFPSSALCRFGGDEFVIAIHEILPQPELIILLDKLIETISKPYKDACHNSISLSASIGISRFPDCGHDIEHLLMCADAAMYQAKALGKKRWVEYQTGMENKLKRLSYLAQKLSLAETNNELSLHYQPIINQQTKQIVSFEALLRWYNPDLGNVNPEELINVAEKTGLIHDIENWVFKRALQDLLTFKKIIGQATTMAVNVSGLHLSDANLSGYVFSLLEKYNLQPEDLTIELTESVLLTNIDSTHSTMNQLIESGITLSIDDFGTGYSSLAYLHAIPASVVKVDKAFLNQVDNNTSTLECIKTLVSSLKMKSLIEGIETEYQAQLLQKLGYNLQQGYFHGRPQPMDYYTNLKLI